MRTNANTDLKVGITVLVGIGLLLFGIGMAKGWKFGSEQHLLYARFPDVGGLEPGDPVFIRGMKRGKVEDITSLPGKDIVVTMNIDKADTIYKDATATIMMLEVMSGKKVEVNLGLAGKFDPAKDTIMGSSPGDISTLVAELNKLSGSFPAIIHNVDSVLRNLTDFFGNGAFKEKAYAALDNADLTLKDLRSVLMENRGALKRTIDQADVLTRELNNTITTLRPDAIALIDSMRTFIKGAGRTLSGADTLLGNINEMLAASKDKKSLLYRLTSDPEMANKFDTLLIRGHQLIEQIRLQGVDANIRFFHSTSPQK